MAIVLLHSYTFPKHELDAFKVAEAIGFEQISLSSEVMPMIKAVPRGFTTCADAYLTPVIKKYVASFCAGFDDGLENVKISFMQSDGGLARMKHFHGHRAILSGPAGGVVGYARTTRPPNSDSSAHPAVIGFDMGGTSTDVSRFDGKFEHVLESVTANVPVRAPQLDIQTVAAGGGSRLFYKNGMFIVGPESVRAHPGPVCYRKNGFLSVTDANLVTGRILPDFFPKIFGPNEDEPLDVEGSRKAFTELTNEINASLVGTDAPAYSVEEVASGFLRVANEAMCRPIRNLTQNKGFDISTHILACFGGAGPQHACSIAKALGMSKVYIHRYSGILSAYGLSVADSVVDKQRPSSAEYSAANKPALVSSLNQLAEDVQNELVGDGFSREDIQLQYFFNMRYEGTDNAVMTRGPVGDKGIALASNADQLLAFDFEASFISKYQREFGFVLQNRAIIIDDVRVRGTISPELVDASTVNSKAKEGASAQKCAPHSQTRFYFAGDKVWKDIPVYLHEELLQQRGAKYSGPAIIMQGTATVVIEPNWEVQVLDSGDLFLEFAGENHSSLLKQATAIVDPSQVPLDSIQLSVFSHRFMGIAEQMGRTLARTSVSVNIKERLDFSCALFGPDGGLVANAPHLPVHLGAMQQAVRHQLKYWGNDLVDGDVLVSNHPQLAGGSHLPDITVITPVFTKASNKIEFFVASRGHHADIGGIAPGSMPPLSKTLSEEGAAIIAFKLVDGKTGEFKEKEITDILLQKGLLDDAGKPRIGTRNLRDNLSDLKAQVAANQRGVVLMNELCVEYSLPVVQAYMTYIQQAAELAVRNMLHEFSLAQQLPEVGSVSAEDFMDDGTKIALRITIDRRSDSAVFDFTGTGPEVFGNVNTPPAVTYSAIIYCLRCLLPGEDLPLNQGCLTPIEVIFPENGSILNPSANAAVVGGNVLTSQRITDVILRAFSASAASQGCMNNLTFGSATLGGYYETIAGGAGAGPSWHGRSGIHTHMTNTRITDPEILEKRYPVTLRAFHLREGSGGNGRFRGGDGVVRELEFLQPMTVSILSERRAFQPYGLSGGEPGARGVNLLTRADGRVLNLGGKNTVDVAPHEILTIYTPGGGGYGAA